MEVVQNSQVKYVKNEDPVVLRCFSLFTGFKTTRVNGRPLNSKQEVVAVPSFYFFQSTIVNHKSSIPMRPPLKDTPEIYMPRIEY